MMPGGLEAGSLVYDSLAYDGAYFLPRASPVQS